jgi:hypothetical protein
VLPLIFRSSPSLLALLSLILYILHCTRLQAHFLGQLDVPRINAGSTKFHLEFRTYWPLSKNGRRFFMIRVIVESSWLPNIKATLKEADF